MDDITEFTVITEITVDVLKLPSYNYNHKLNNYKRNRTVKRKEGETVFEITVSVIISVSISLFLSASLLKIYAQTMQKRFLDIYEILHNLATRGVKADSGKGFTEGRDLGGTRK